MKAESHQTERTGGCWCHAAPRSIRYRIWVCQGFRRNKIFERLLKISHITYRFHPESTRIAFSPDIRYQYISINHIMIYHFPCFPIAIWANSLETDRDRHHERPTRQCQEWTISMVNTEVADRRLAMQSGDFLKIWFQCLSHLISLSSSVKKGKRKQGKVWESPLVGKEAPSFQFMFRTWWRPWHEPSCVCVKSYQEA